MANFQENQLENLDKYILQKYADGASYQDLQDDLFEKFGLTFDKRRLGWKMGEIKKKMGCQTQFEMGYVYAHKSFEEIAESYKAQISEKNLLVSAHAKMNEMLLAKLSLAKTEAKSKVLYGINIASVFWIIVLTFVFIQKFL